jgi:hypothetical protein
MVMAKLESGSPHYHITYKAALSGTCEFRGSETILGTTIGFRGLGMPAPSNFTFVAEDYEAKFTGTLTSELALSLFGNTKIRAYGFLEFSDTAGNKGRLDLNRQGYATFKINDQPAASHALVKLIWLKDFKPSPQPL